MSGLYLLADTSYLSVALIAFVRLRYANRTYSLAAADELKQWLNNGAAIYVCGSMVGMSQAVDQTLKQVLGEAAVTELALAGRYNRDVY